MGIWIYIEFFKNIFLKVLNNHAPVKTKYLRENHSPFVTKELSKDIMLRSKLRSQYLKCKSEEARTRFKIQRNLVSPYLERLSVIITKMSAGRILMTSSTPLYALHIMSLLA